MYLFIPFFANAQDTIPQNQVVVSYEKCYVFKNDSLWCGKPNLIRSIGNVPSDLWQITKAPFQRKNLVGLTVVAVSTAMLVAKDQTILNWVVKQNNSIGLNSDTRYNAVVRMDDLKIIKIPLNINSALYQLGEGGTSMMIAGGLWIYGKIKKDTRAINTAYDLTETFITMGVTSQILKRISGRESPFAATRTGGKWTFLPSFTSYQRHTSTYDAFPSGHLATMVATVTVLASNYPEKKWIKPVGYSLIGLCAWAMMNTEVHWVGDYPLAVAIGYLSGKITTWRHKKEQKSFDQIINL